MSEVVYKPGKKMLWFTADQMRVLDEIKEFTGKSNGEIVREGMNLLLASIKKEAEFDKFFEGLVDDKS